MARRGLRTPAHLTPRPTQTPNSPQAANRPGEQGTTEEDPETLFFGERIRRVALGLLAALVVARAFWPSEPDLREGAGEGLSWVLAVIIVTGVALASSLVSGRFRFRWSWTDAFVVLLMILVSASASHALDRRPAISLAWEWTALGLAYLLLRNLPRTRSESSVLAGVLVATAVAVSVYGLYQVTVELPALTTQYIRDPASILQKLNIEPGTRGQKLLENRLLGSIEPWSTFALTNSLAGFIVGPLVMALAVALENVFRRDTSGSRFTALALATPALLAMLVCLLATKSRSAWVGALVGTGLLAWRARRQASPRVLFATGLSAAGILLALVIAGVAIRRLDPLVLTQTALSLGYRWEYWQGAWGVISEGAHSLTGALGSPTFWRGVGPGNFGGPYLKYKLPQSSEEIVDPHNLFLEVWSTGGFWALLALLAALALGVWNVLGPPPRRDTEAAHTTRRQRRRQIDTPPSLAHEPMSDEEPGTKSPRSTWLIVCGMGGWAVVVILGRLNPFQGDLFNRWLIVGGAWLAAVFLGAPLWSRLPIRAVAPGAGALAVVVNLLAAGGIGIPTVALGLWSMLALGLNLRDERSCSRLRAHNGRISAFVLAIVWAAALGTFAGEVGPFWKSEMYLAQAETAVSHHPPNYTRAEAACLSAIEADRFSTRPLLKLAELTEIVWLERGARAEDQRWKAIPRLYNEAVTPPRNPAAWALHARRAVEILRLLNIVGSKLEPMEAVRYRGEIVEATRLAVRLYPTSAELHARLAEASAEISMYKDAADEAEAALKLDRTTPHADKKLPPVVRDRLEARLPKWRDSAAKMPINTPP